MSDELSETTRLLGGDNKTVNRMADNSRKEEYFYENYSLWGQFSMKFHCCPCFLFTTYSMVLLLKAVTYFLITTQPATSVIIVSAVIIMMTVVLVLGNVIGIIAFRFGGASIKTCQPSFVLYSLSFLLSMFVMCTIFPLGITTVVLTPTYVPDTNYVLSTAAKSSFDNYLTDQTIQETWDKAQEDLKCCGLNSFTDYENLFNNLSVPVSCCNTTHPLVNQSTCPEIVTNATLAHQISQIYTDGCVSHLESFYRYIFKVVGWYYISWGIVMDIFIMTEILLFLLIISP